MYYPNYEITVGSKTFTPSSTKVFDIKVKCGLCPKVDTLELTLTRDEETEKMQRGEKVAVKIGYEDNLQTVFSGIVDLIEKSFRQIRVYALNRALHLTILKLNRVYLNQTAGNIVSDILETLNKKLTEKGEEVLEHEKIMDGIMFPYYVIGENMSAYEHIARLAEKSNYICYTTPEGLLNFRAYERKEPYTLKYGENIIEVSLIKLFNPIGGITVYGESPSSWAGRETFHWLSKKDYSGTSTGKGVHELILKDYTIKDTDTVNTVAENIYSRRRIDFMTFLRTLGEPKIKVSDTVKVENVPETQETIELQVIEVEHHLNFMEGFTTLVGGMEVR
ncbi:MAG: hypothetical protein QXG36_03245 [Nitrososphaeria archaeon]